MGNAVLHYFATPKSKVPGAGKGGGGSPSVTTKQQDSQPLTSQNPPFSPPYQQSSPMKASTPSSAPQAYFPGGDGVQMQQVPTNISPHYQQQDPTAPVRPAAMPPAQNQGYPFSSNPFQRTTSSSSTSSQAWDPNSSGGSAGIPSSQRIDLNASSSSMQSIPSAHSPHKWESHGSTDSNEGYMPSQMSPSQHGRAFGDFQPSSGPTVMPHQIATGPTHQHQPIGQNLQQQGISGGYQQFMGAPQGGHMIPPNPNERVRSSSGPIAYQSQGQAGNQQEGLWMASHQPQQQQQQQQQRAQRPNSGHLFQVSPQPGYGNQGKLANLIVFNLGVCGLYCLTFIVLWAGALPVQSAIQNDLNIEDIEVPCGQPVTNMVRTNVHVQNIPPKFRNIGLKYYLEKVMGSAVTCEVEQFNADAIAVFQPPIGNYILFLILCSRNSTLYVFCRYECPYYEV